MAKDTIPPAPPEPTASPADRALGRAPALSALRVQTWFLGIIAAAVVLFVLSQARFLLISLVIAIILFSLTSDAINSIARLRLGPLRIPNWLATVAAVLLISTGLLTLSAVVLSQINTVVSTALAYADQAQLGLAEVFGWMGQDVEAAVVASIRSIEIGSYLRAIAGQAGDFFSATVLVVLLVGFLFAERIWFDTKLTLLTGDPARAERIGGIIASIMRRVNRYLLVKSLVSLLTGALVYGVMRIFGLEFAQASGVLTFVLNFVPNVGSIVATVLVALIALVQVPEPSLALAVFAIVAAIQFVVGNVLDPMLMGRALRLSSFGILLSLAFWGAVWGVPGMFLSIPIMVAVMIVCAHIPALRPFAVLLSREGIPEEEMPSLPEDADRP